MPTALVMSQLEQLKRFPRVATIFLVEGNRVRIPEPDGLAVEQMFSRGGWFGRKGVFDKDFMNGISIPLLMKYLGEIEDMGDFYALHGSVRWLGVELANGATF